MIKEAYCSFEVAKLLKEKGFNEECEYFYDEYKDEDKYVVCSNGRSAYNDDKHPTYYSMPTHQKAIKWLREKYHLHIWIDYSRLDCDDKQPYLWNIVETKIDGNYWGGTNHKTYEEAAETALKYTLENLI